MKIGIIVCTFPPYKGGMGNAAFEQARRLVMLGNDVTVFTPRYKKEQEKFEEMDGVKVYRLTPVFKYGNAAFLPQVYGKLKDFNTIFLHYPCFGVAEIVRVWKMFNSKKKLVMQYHMDVKGKGILGLFFRIYAKTLMPWILKGADKIIVSSFDYAKNSDARGLVDAGWVEIPFGVDVEETEKYRNKEIKDDDGMKTVLFVGGLDKAHYFKGVPLLIKAMENIKCKILNIKCYVVGGGDMREEYQRLAKDKGLEDVITFPGRVSDMELDEYYRKASVLVLPSVDRGEAFGIVLIEAMARGVPVIASDLAGVRSVVDYGKNGFLVKPKDVKGLASKIEWVLKNPEKAREMGEAGRKKVEEKYDWEKIGVELSRILH